MDWFYITELRILLISFIRDVQTLNNLALTTSEVFSYISDIEFWRERFIQDGFESKEELLTVNDVVYFYYNYMHCRKIAMQIMLIGHYSPTNNYCITIDNHLVTFFGETKFPSQGSPNANYQIAYNKMSSRYMNKEISIYNICTIFEITVNRLNIITHILMHDGVVSMPNQRETYYYKFNLLPCSKLAELDSNLSKKCNTSISYYRKLTKKIQEYSNSELQEKFSEIGSC